MATRPRGFGLSADVKHKMDSKYDSNLEQEARVWLEQLTGQRLSEDADQDTPLGKKVFHEALKDGQIICEAMNVLSPGSIKKINNSQLAFKRMENIGNFLTAAEAYGLKKVDMFMTVDLYEGNNLVQVINGIHALGRKARAKGFEGPVLGPKESSYCPRNFDEKTLKAGEGIIGLQAGTNKGENQSGMILGKTRSILD